MTSGPTGDAESLYPRAYQAPGWDAYTERKNRKKRGRRWLLAAVSAAVVITAIFFGVNAVRDLDTTEVSMATRNPESINAVQAAVGLCLEGVGANGRVETVTAVPCDVSHGAEIVADFDFSGETFPGTTAVRTELLDFCSDVIQPGNSAAAMFQSSDWEQGLRWVAWVPSADAWESGIRRGVCVAYRDGGTLVGSFVAGTVQFEG